MTMRTFNSWEKSIIRHLVDAAQDTPVAVHDLLKRFYFREALGRALILQNQGAYAAFFLKKDIFDDPHRKAEEIRRFFELLSLLNCLNRNGHITIYRQETEKIYFIQDGFDAPKVTGNTILLNTRGHYTTAPDAIYDGNRNVIYEGVVFRNDHYNLMLNVTAGFLLVSGTLCDIIKGEKGERMKKTKTNKRRRPFAAGVLLVLCMLLALFGYVLLLRSEAKEEDAMTHPEVMETEQEKAYYGIDISRYNGNLASLLSPSDSLTFVICKATEGVTLVDALFKLNCARIRANGYLLGAYHFYRTGDDPQAQAAFFWKTISAQGGTDIAPVVDVEYGSFPKNSTFRSVAKLQRNLLRFLDLLETLSHRKPILYTNRSFADVYLLNMAFSKYPLWLADYSGADTPRLPKTWKTAGYKIRQTKDDYIIHSHQSNYDVFYGKLSDLTN